MEADKYLRDEFGRGMKANSSSLNADLSQIEIIFADKTGTLTENKMVFKMAATRSGFVHDEQIKPGGLFHVVTSPPTKQDGGSQPSTPVPTSENGGLLDVPLQDSSAPSTADAQRHPLLTEPDADKDKDEEAKDKEEPKTMPFSETDQYWVHELLLDIAINNMITPHTDEKTGQIKLEGESPDEVALLKAAFANGYRLVNRTDETIELDVCGKRMLYKLLTTMKFDSDRKRMSVLVQEIPLDAHGHPIPEDQLRQSDEASPRPSLDGDSKRKKVQHARVGSHARTGSSQFFGFIKGMRKSQSKVICYTKGADTTLLPLLSPKEKTCGADKNAMDLIDKFAREGLRTLLFCRKEVPKSEFEGWIKRLKQAEVSSDANRDDRIAELYEEVENGFEIIGLTAIEDRLQDRVPETISFFRQANIQLWMLTGDKRETAINIGYSANLLDRDKSVVHVVDADSLKKCTM
jgi:phospholipid-translocating ATPase